MSISTNTIVTSAGLDYIMSAGDDGAYCAVKYFLPVYDYRIDDQIHNGNNTSTIDLSASMSASDTEPFGEIIYNIDADDHSYSLSTTDDFVISAGVETLNGNLLTNSVMSKPQKINLYDGVPLQNVVSGSDVDASATTNAWEITDPVQVAGVNDVPTKMESGTKRYFSVVDYYPQNDGTKTKGTYKLRLNKGIGNVKFNKLALYVIGENETGSPALFGETALSTPVIKTDFGEDGFDDFVMDVQIQVASKEVDFDNLFYATSADYWSRTPGGVYYSEKVGIGTFTDNIQAPQAKLHVRDEVATHVPQIRFDYNNTTSAGLQTDGNGNIRILLDEDGVIYPHHNSIQLGDNSHYYSDIYATSAHVDYLTSKNGFSIELNRSIIKGDTDDDVFIGDNNDRIDRVYTGIIDANSGVIDDLTASTAEIGTVDADNVNASTINANIVQGNNGNFTNLTNVYSINGEIIENYQTTEPYTTGTGTLILSNGFRDFNTINDIINDTINFSVVNYNYIKIENFVILNIENNAFIKLRYDTKYNDIYAKFSFPNSIKPNNEILINCLIYNKTLSNTSFYDVDSDDPNVNGYLRYNVNDNSRLYALRWSNPSSDPSSEKTDTPYMSKDFFVYDSDNDSNNYIGLPAQTLMWRI